MFAASVRQRDRSAELLSRLMQNPNPSPTDHNNQDHEDRDLTLASILNPVTFWIALQLIIIYLACCT